MINLASLSKRLLILTTILVCSVLFTNIHAQSLDFKYKIDSLRIGSATEYSVTITVNKEIGPFSYSLYEGIPWNGGTLLETDENIKNSTYTFKKLQPKKLYMLIVQLQNNSEAITRKSFKIQ